MLRLPLLIVSLLVSTLLWSQTKTAAEYYAEGKALLDKDQHKEAMVAFQNAIAKDPKHAQSLYEVGWLYNEQEKYEDALVFLNRAAKADPKDNRANFEIGYAYNNLGKTKQAISFYRKALKMDADYVEAMFELGVIYKDLGKFDSAMYFFNNYTDIDPDDFNNEIYYQIAWIQSEQGKYKEALENLEKYDPEEDADIAFKFTEMGFAYYKLKDSTKAIESYLSALEADEDHVTALMGLGDVHFGLTENYDKAIPYYTKAIRTDEKKAQACYYKLGWILNDKEDYSSAVAMLQKAVEADPKDLSNREELGYTLNMLQRYNEALVQLNKGLQISPKAPVAQYYKGLAYIGLKNKTEAMKSYTALKSTDMDKANKLLEKINKL